MRLLPNALAIILLFALLTWLLLRGIGIDADGYAAARQAIDDFALAHASLHRDVLRARAGLLRNYDSLVHDIGSMADAVTRLRSRVHGASLDSEPTDRLFATLTEQEEITERFKSSNALLQNSLSYLSLLTTTTTFDEFHRESALATAALAAAILYLTRDTSPDALDMLRDRIEQLRVHAPADGEGAAAVKGMQVHALLLQDLLPAVDQALKDLIAVPTGQTLDQARAQIASHQANVENTARAFRLLMYVVSVLLLMMLSHLGLRLRARAIALHTQAAFEHVLAENSARLINSPAGETNTRLPQVLAQLSQASGMQRAYVVLEEGPTRLYTWAEDGAPSTPNWPVQALPLFRQTRNSLEDIITVPDVAALPAGAAKDACIAAGVRGWACIPILRQGRLQGIMGFDAFRPSRDQFFPSPVFRVAGDAVASAIEREFLELERERLSTRLEGARRMQVVGSLASGIAHNFNNIIGAILGYSEMLGSHLTPESKPSQHVEEIRRAAERGQDLIDKILVFGRRREARNQPLPVHSLFEEAASMLRASLSSKVELVIEPVATDVAVAGEPTQLQQVVLNLCSNAAQAIQGSGQIRLSAERKRILDYLPVSHGVIVPGEYVCLAVTDTGCGFDERVGRRLFEPFFTTRSAGTGLGLATVREIVRDHDGAINVRSRPGHGSRFEVWLPAATVVDTAPIKSRSLSRGQGETVLIVEGDTEQLLRNEEMLAALGYEPIGFENPASAIQACVSNPDRFDALIICEAAQGREGLTLSQSLHQIAPKLPLLLATASTIDARAEVLAQAGISEILRRPLVGSELAEALARCLDGALHMKFRS